MLKDCMSSCEESGCNQDAYPAAAKFSSDSPQDSCYACKYIEKDDGSVQGNKFCADEPDKLQDAFNECPIYANAACYTGTNAHYVR